MLHHSPCSAPCLECWKYHSVLSLNLTVLQSHHCVSQSSWKPLVILVLLLMLLVGVNAMKNERFFLFYLWRNVVLIRLRKVAFSADYGQAQKVELIRHRYDVRTLAPGVWGCGRPSSQQGKKMLNWKESLKSSYKEGSSVVGMRRVLWFCERVGF